MKDLTVIINCRAVLKDRILPHARIIIEDGHIEHIGNIADWRGPIPNTLIDAEGSYVLPGLIDIHSDAIEKAIEPRPRAYFDPGLAFMELEKSLAGQGITTMFHSFSVAGAELGVRQDENVARVIRSIADISGNVAMIRNRFHVRFEITNHRAASLVKMLINSGLADLLSFMDHTPGQGQYPTVEDYQDYVTKTYHHPLSDVEKILREKAHGRAFATQTTASLARAARVRNVPLASHDDDNPDQIREYASNGVSICEFPINLEAARIAREIGNHVCVGAPNVLRGGSTGKALKAADAISQGYADILCSDYYPPALLQAIFYLARSGMALPEAVAMATANPASATNLQGLGELKEGNKADIIVVDDRRPFPAVTHALVDGKLVCSLKPRSACDERAVTARMS